MRGAQYCNICGKQDSWCRYETCPHSEDEVNEFLERPNPRSRQVTATITSSDPYGNISEGEPMALNNREIEHSAQEVEYEEEETAIERENEEFLEDLQERRRI